jgi:hypothetical protein
VGFKKGTGTRHAKDQKERAKEKYVQNSQRLVLRRKEVQAIKPTIGDCPFEMHTSHL